MNAWTSAGTRDHMEGGVEHYLCNLALAAASLELLERLTAISAEDLNHTPGDICTCDKCAIWIDSEHTKWIIVSLDCYLHRLFGHYKQQQLYM